jgi:hypothetical protein
MTPAQIELLLHCHTIGAPPPRLEVPHTQEMLVHFVGSNILREHDERRDQWVTTERGDALVKMLCATPYPIAAFIDPRDDTVC